jgi:8-oxo-dGTP pyrophosphatase MutT (NUDIX family)
MEDLLDEVDEQDCPTGRIVARLGVDEGSGILHRCVAVYVFDAMGRVYLQHHKKSGLFDHSVGGHVDAGEDYPTAARREAEEELGLRNVPLQELGLGIRSHERHSEHMFGVYECTPDHNWRFVPNDEVAEITPMTFEDLVTEVNKHPARFTGGCINVLRFYIQYKKLPFIIAVDGSTIF